VNNSWNSCTVKLLADKKFEYTFLTGNDASYGTKEDEKVEATGTWERIGDNDEDCNIEITGMHYDRLKKRGSCADEINKTETGHVTFSLKKGVLRVVDYGGLSWFYSFQFLGAPKYSE